MKDRNGVEVRVGDRVKIVDYEDKRGAKWFVGRYVTVRTATAPAGSRFFSACLSSAAFKNILLLPREIELPVTTVVARSLSHAR